MLPPFPSNLDEMHSSSSILRLTENFRMMNTPSGKKRMTTTMCTQRRWSVPRRLEMVVCPKSTSVP